MENLSPSATGPGGRSNSVVISLGQGLTKAGIQNLKKKRHGGDSGGSKDGGGGGGGGDGGHNSRTGISDLDCLCSPLVGTLVAANMKKALLPDLD